MEDLPQGTLVTRETVMALISSEKSVSGTSLPQGEKRLVIYGAGGHGCSLAALVRHSEDYEILGFLDDGLPEGSPVDGLPVLGGGEKLVELAQAGIRLAVNGVGGIGDLPARLSVYRKLAEASFFCPSVIHRTAFLEKRDAG